MKSERRHELRENDLAHTLTVTRDFFEQYSRQITFVALAALVIFVIGTFVVRSRATAREDLWRQKNALQFQGAQDGTKSVDQLLTLVEQTTDRRFVLDGLVEAGNEALRLAGKAPFPPDPGLNAKARQAFETLLRRFPREPLAASVALSGLATVEENEFLLDHDPSHQDKTRGHLTRLSTDPMFHGLPLQRLAVDRLKSLDRVFQVTEFAPPPSPPPVEIDEVADPVEVEGADMPVQVDGPIPVKIERVEEP